MSPRGLGLFALAVGAVACAEGGDGKADRDPPGALPDACPTTTYYRDVDGDGHGDPAAAVAACDPPADAVASNDDCDDNDPRRYPGLAELCDGLDNDCSAATTEVCPAGCMAMRRPPPDNLVRVYLACTTTVSWPAARTVCADAGYRLVEIEDAAENAFVRAAADLAFGGTVDVWIGGSDSAAEQQWTWDGSVPFWQGNENGAAVGGKYASWSPGEPNDDGTEDCAEMKPGGTWNDVGCGEGQRFICRR